jgi:MYXO-CTERM domain-containing protein
VHPVPEPPAGTTAWLALGGMLAGRRSRRRFVADLWG